MVSLPLYILLLWILAFSQHAPAKDFGHAFARHDENAPFPEPLIFHNLTQEAFIVKLSEYRRSWIHERATSDSTEDSLYHNTNLRDQVRTVNLDHSTSSLVFKRDPVEGEILNNTAQQELVEDLTQQCHQKFPNTALRFINGRCIGEKRLDWFCNVPGYDGSVRRHTTRRCKSTKENPKKCTTKAVYNHRRRLIQAPFCADVIRVEKKTQGTGSIPTYDSYKPLPDYDGYKTLPDEVMSPGTTNAYFETEWDLAVDTAKFDYRGLFASGKEFHSQSPNHSHSWACLGCPPGTLHVQTVGFAALALGAIYPAGSFL